MSQATLTIALDAMGGDSGPKAVVIGASIARIRHPHVHYIFYGDEEKINKYRHRYKDLMACSTVHHTAEKIDSDTKPAIALRSGRQSSMRLAIDAVAAGNAHCVVSSGNTGALMAMAKFVLKTLPGIDRPAIVGFFPTLKGESVMLDLGANAECSPQNLFDFAVMGAIFANTVLGIINPTIGVLNVGAEETKGREDVRQAAALLRAAHLPGQFIGFVEGDDIPKGAVDVVVTDGFSGNIALKTAEGTVKLYSEYLRRTFNSSPLAMLGYLFAKSAFKKLKSRTDPRMYNGAMFVGLRGVCVKSHGGSDATGFANAIGVAYDLAKNDFNKIISDSLQAVHLKQNNPLSLSDLSENPANDYVAVSAP